jgi:hypothetical protein
MEIERLKAWGTEEETIIETAKGIFLIQSPDLTVGYEELDSLPEEFDELELPIDLEIPEDIL